MPSGTSTNSTTRSDDGVLVVGGGVVLGSNFLLLTYPTTGMIYGAAALFALGNGIIWPSFLAILSRVAGDHQGTVQGFASSAGSAASIVGLIAGGLLYDTIGPSVFLLSAGTIFLVTVLSLKLLSVPEADPPEPEPEPAAATEV